jgi:hypothetical protein
MKDRSIAISSYGAASCLNVVEGSLIKLFFCLQGLLNGDFDFAQPPDRALSAFIFLHYFPQIARITQIKLFSGSETSPAAGAMHTSPLLVFSPTGSKCRSLSDKTQYFFLKVQ